MQMPSPCSDRKSVRAAGALCLVFAALLTGCASKNPLMDEPAPAATREARPAAAPTQTAAAGTGVQTTNKRRFFGIFSPYRIDIQQGNFVSQEMVAQLKEGMTPDQVRFVLGAPLLNDIFHADRWDYPFRLEKGNGEVTTSRVSVFFKDNRLARFEGGNLPTEEDYLARIAGAIPKAKNTTAAPAPAAAPSSANDPKN
jgi:outer membrane protein assembly factor BamE